MFANAVLRAAWCIFFRDYEIELEDSELPLRARESRTLEHRLVVVRGRNGSSGEGLASVEVAALLWVSGLAAAIQVLDEGS